MRVCDLVALKARYHFGCVLSLCTTSSNNASKEGNTASKDNKNVDNHRLDGMVLVELLTFLKDARVNAWSKWRIHGCPRAFCRTHGCYTIELTPRHMLMMTESSSLKRKKGRAFDAMPLAKATLREHNKRAACLGDYCWGQAPVPTPTLPSPADWGWLKKDDRLQPFSTTLPDVTRSCRELLRM